MLMLLKTILPAGKSYPIISKVVFCFLFIGSSSFVFAQQASYSYKFEYQMGIGLTAPAQISGIANQNSGLLSFNNALFSAGVHAEKGPQTKFGLHLGISYFALPLNIHYAQHKFITAPDSVRYPMVSQLLLELPLYVRHSFNQDSKRFWHIGIKPGYVVSAKHLSYINNKPTTTSINDGINSFVVSAEIGRGKYFDEGKKFSQLMFNYRLTNLFENGLTYRPFTLSFIVGF